MGKKGGNVSKSSLTPKQVEDKCQLMQRTGTAINYKSVGRCLGVSGDLLAREERLREVVDRYRTAVEVGDRSRETRERTQAFNRQLEEAARARSEGLKVWVDESIKGSWNPSIAKQIKEREAIRRRVRHYDPMY